MSPLTLARILLALSVTAPALPKLIPKSLLGTSVWVEVVLAKYFNHQPTERLLASWELLGLDRAASTVNAGLPRLQPLFTPIDEALRHNFLNTLG